MEYIKGLLKQDYHTVLIGYGNTFLGNKKVNASKKQLEELLKEAKANVVELVDEDEEYAEMSTIHPLFAGQRFSGHWNFRKFIYDVPHKKPSKKKTKKVEKQEEDVSEETDPVEQVVSDSNTTPEQEEDTDEEILSDTDDTVETEQSEDEEE